MIKSGDVLICIENTPSIFGENSILPLLKPLHVDFITNEKILIWFKEISGEFFDMRYHKFITQSEYRKLKLNKLSDKSK